ncbi:hypothetical protein AX15_002758 [Amanita polypyramis BW_CC]|nr:hypothetical protein AX15_002758 [Amanita polypyramis BW_CC]
MATSRASLRSQLLRSALPLVRTHGFTREALARSVLSQDNVNHVSNLEHSEPLSEEAVSALFGQGDDARRTLIQAWLDEGLSYMREAGKQSQEQQQNQIQNGLDPRPGPSLGQVLHARLAYNEPVLSHIPEAFALLISPLAGVPPLDPIPAVKHAGKVANEACHAINDRSLQMAWYTNRASVAAIYVAAELHQLTSPTTAHVFLDSLLESSTTLKKSVEEVQTYSDFIIRSWVGIIKSWGVF